MPDDDPFFSPDLAQRPRPGAGRRSGAEPTLHTRSAPTPALEPLPVQGRALLGVGLNPLVKAASPLLLMAGQLRGTISGVDVPGLKRYVLDEVRRFEEQARVSGVQPEIILAARYALCTSLDEAVLSTPWGGQSEWAENSLLVTLHREAWGGEKFFEVLNRISVDPARHIDLMELMYLAIALGFTGMYQQRERGHDQLAVLERELYAKIRAQRGPSHPDLSLQWRGLEVRRNRLIRYVPWWLVVLGGAAVLAIAFAIYYARLASQAEPVQARLTRIGMDAFAAAPPAAPVAGPTLKQLLAADEAAGVLTVEENGGRTLVTLRSADLFGSGSATVNPAYEAALARLAEALNRVPGRVLVTGHTDDQPIKSLRFRDNFELSRERAVSVAEILKRTLTSAGRLSWNGVGSSEPRYRPESEPQNRARNRRVEIVHLRD